MALMKSFNGYEVCDEWSRNSHLDSFAIMSDAENYAQLNDRTASLWGFTADATVDGHWYALNTLKRDTFISEPFPVIPGMTYLVSYEMATSVMAYSIPNDSSSNEYSMCGIGFAIYDGSNTATSWIRAATTQATANATPTAYSGIITIPDGAAYAQVWLQIQGWSPFEGSCKVRRVFVSRYIPPQPTAVFSDDGDGNVTIGLQV